MRKKLLIVFLLLVFCFPAIRQVFGPGFYSLHDDLHVAWLDQMDRALKSGQIPPRWAPDLSFSYGYPLFNFVYPLPFYLAEIFHLLGLSLVASIKAVFIFSIFASAITMYFFLRRHFSKFFSFLGTLLYIYTPYRAVEIFVRGALGEALVFVFLPLIALLVEKIVKEKGIKNQILAGISIGLLILCHNIGALMALPFLLIYGLILALKSKGRITSLFNLLRSFVLGGILSAYFWLPAMIEKRYMVADTVFNYQDHFPFIKQLIFPSWGYGISTWGPYDGMSFQIGIVNLIAVAIALIVFIIFWLKKKKNQIPLLIWLLFSFFACLFLMNIRSSFLWRLIPLLPYFQFPWRFLLMTTFITPVLFCFGEYLSVRNKNLKNIFGAVLLIVTLVLVLPYFRPEKVFPKRTDDYFLHRYFANRDKNGYTQTVSPAYLEIKEEYLRLPLWTQRKPTTLPRSKIEAIGGSLNFEEKNPVFFEGKISSPKPTEIVLHQYYYPGWKAWLDDQAVPIDKNPPFGDIKISVPVGNHQFLFKFGETTDRRLIDLASLAFWIGSLTILLVK